MVYLTHAPYSPPRGQLHTYGILLSSGAISTTPIARHLDRYAAPYRTRLSQVLAGCRMYTCDGTCRTHVHVDSVHLPILAVPLVQLISPRLCKPQTQFR